MDKLRKARKTVELHHAHGMGSREKVLKACDYLTTHGDNSDRMLSVNTRRELGEDIGAFSMVPLMVFICIVAVVAIVVGLIK